MRSSVDYALGSDVENLSLTGSGAIDGTGNVLDNILVGNIGANKLYGGDGADRLDGRAGADALTGGLGADTFVFRSGYGNDVITDFALGIGGGDVIELSLGANYDTLGELLLAGRQVGANTVLTFGGGDTLILQNVTKSSLVAEDFHFV